MASSEVSSPPQNAAVELVAKSEKSLDSISIAQIRALIAFVDGGSIVAGAKQLSRDQSTVSRQLSAFGATLPFALTRRSGKETIPTNRAYALAARLKKLLSDTESFIADNSDKALWVRFGCGATSLHSLVVPNIEKLRTLLVESGPETSRVCRLHLGNMRSEETVAGLKDGRLDFGVVRESAIEDIKSLSCSPIGTVSYNVVMAKRYADALGVRSLPDIASKRVPVVTLSGSGEFKRELRARLEESGPGFNLTDELDFFSDVVMAVRCNPIAGIVPNTALAHEPDEDLYLRFPLTLFAEGSGRSRYDRSFVLVWNPKLAVEKFAPKLDGLDKDAWLLTRVIEPMVRLFAATIAHAARSAEKGVSSQTGDLS